MCASNRVLCENVSGHSGHWLASNWSPCLSALCSSYCHFMSKTSWHSSQGKHLQGICVFIFTQEYQVPFRIEQKDLLLHMKLLMLVKLSQGSKGFVTDGTEKLHPSGRLWRRLHWKNTSAWALQVWFQLLTEIPSWHVFFLQTPLSCLQLILRFWCHCRVTLGFFQISASNLKKMIPLRHKNHITRIKPRIRRMKPQFGKVWFSTVVNTPERYLFFGFTRYYTIF